MLPNAKDDGFGNMTIGYGHKVDPKNEPELVHGSITREKAEKLFQRDLRKAEAAVARHVTVPQTQRQRDAVASLIFNIGAERFNRSKLKEAINNNAGKAAITKEWSEFRLARDQKTGLLKPSEGLKERRKLEINRYFNPGP